MTDHDRTELARIICERSYLRGTPGTFLLTSGETSSNYFDPYPITSLATALPLIGRVFLKEILRLSEIPPIACGGPTHGADPIAQAVAHVSLSELPHPIDLFSVRLGRKKHGPRNWIEGCPPKGSRVVIVDDAVVTGASALHAIRRCQDEGLLIVAAVILIDRGTGGIDAIRRRIPNQPVSAIFSKQELDELIASNAV